MRVNFQQELDALHREVLKMSAILEATIDKMLEGFVNRDIPTLEEVIDRDDLIDEIEHDIEKKCLLLILQQQPVATDLRNLASILKLITDLERIADHCTDISEYLIKIIQLDAKEYKYEYAEIMEMAKLVKKMVSDTIESYVRLDDVMALEIADGDDKIDDYFERIAEDLKTHMKEDGAFIEEGVKFLYIIKYLERMADHATNVCEWIAYRVTGDRRLHQPK